MSSNAYGELWLNDRTDRPNPTQIPFFDALDVVDVTCGNEYSAFLCADGRVYTCGYNDSGQCGVGSMDPCPQLVLVPALTDKRIVRLVAGNGSEHVVAISANGSIFTFGFNRRGQLGHGSMHTAVEPVEVKSLSGKVIVDAACSYFHTVVVTAEGEVYACGRNDFGQLGTTDYADRLEPIPVNYFASHRVLSIACGQYHTIAALVEGGVVAFGKNDHGQLGTENAGVTSTPVLIDRPLDSMMVSRVACGYYHSIALTVEGRLYAFGRNDHGQLGLGHNQHVRKPALIEALCKVRVADVACGCYHTLALSEEGRVYPFGRNNHGQLGLNSQVDCCSPQVVTELRGKVVTKLAAGFYHSISVLGHQLHPAQQRRSLAVDMKKLVNNPNRSDVMFVVEQRRLHAHSCILTARCDILDKMLDGRMRESSLSEIEIPDHSYEVFAAFLEYLYTDDVESVRNGQASTEFLLELLSLSDQYLDANLKRCTAHVHDCHRLKQSCLNYIIDHFGDVIATENFVSLPQPLLQEVLRLAARFGVSVKNQH
ncbi:TPA: hypothetical protein N0F65_002402 [Lagenidium giganteum]|uniref:BTB domain-containing protein n=1 Tax=Lagenidium giganteum TaxID=4803 RepID=A0AAV2YNV9_9STRA|nr:TPA: hypothetical protein N0F65_002402 [Lagenidium giganteum]